MREINLAQVLTAKRREKGVTQDRLAEYMGVSKASVSKWETGQSYPDITFLPVLASYFDISIDSLMNYSPQLDKPQIQKIYSRLAADFASEKPHEEILAECETLIKKYFSCYPFLLEMAQLYYNHSITSEAHKEQMLQRVIELSGRVITECNDVKLTQLAAFFQAMCYLSTNLPAKVFELFGEEIPLAPTRNGDMIAQAHMMLGNAEKAKSVMQAELFVTQESLLGGLVSYCQTCLAIGDIKGAETAFNRAEKLSEVFETRGLNANSVAIMYIMGANIYMALSDENAAIAALEKYTEVCVNGFFPLKISGDDFFTTIDKWLSENMSSIPRNEKLIKESMLGVFGSPAFEPLRNNPDFITIENKMKKFAGGEE